MLATVANHTTRTPLLVCLGLVCAGASVIMAVLVFFGMRAYVYRAESIRFGLATVFLVMIPLCISLAWARWVFLGAQASGVVRVSSNWFVLMFAGFSYLVVSSVVLLLFTEAIVWLAAVLVRGVVRWRRALVDREK